MFRYTKLSLPSFQRFNKRHTGETKKTKHLTRSTRIDGST